MRIRYEVVALRTGLAFVFLYTAVVGFMDPGAYIKWIPGFVLESLPVGAVPFLISFFIFEAVLAVWLLWGKWGVAAAVISAALLFAITFLNLNAFGVLFRNVGLIAAAVALGFMEGKGQTRNR
ncbi:MAG TPA: hypothetical protein VFE94_03515 [Candidatus Paceibacterota bacterium]|nr:hypothetical protein [Candidatus Paceibacterota bacterium]